MIERAYREAEAQGLAVWTQDEAGPYRSCPQPGQSWQPASHPARQSADYMREFSAKLMTLFHPGTGQVRLKGVASTTNDVLHPWLKQELAAILATLPEPPLQDQALIQATWAAWQAGLTVQVPLPATLPALRLLLVLDNLQGHKSRDLVA